jgi:hypothetical protein
MLNYLKLAQLVNLRLGETIHQFEKELSSLEDCGELHKNEASQVNFSRENFEIVCLYFLNNMASPGFNNFDVELIEEDIPGAFLAGRILSKLKMDELRFWLKCRGDSCKGLKTKTQFVRR